MAQETTGASDAKGKAEIGLGSAATAPMEPTRDELAAQLVERFSLWSGAAGLIPIPLVDVVAVGGVQLQMLRRLSEMYGVPFSENRGKSILASFAGAVFPASTATTAAMGFGSLVKSLPGIGTIAGALTMPVVSAGATWVIGQVFIKHFASGGTLLDFNPPDYREFIKVQKEKFAARSAAKAAGAQAVNPAAQTGANSTPSPTI